jgi:excisionase family DNA binding protein
MFIDVNGGSTVQNQHESPSNDPLLDYRAASTFLGIATGTLQIWVSTRRYSLPFFKVGRSVRFKRSELMAWLDTRKRGGEVSAPEPE